MGKILFLGNKATESRFKGISGADFITAPEFYFSQDVESNQDVESKLSDFVSGHCSGEVDAIVMDADNIHPRMCLELAMCIRLSVFEIGRNALVPIILATGSAPAVFKGYTYSSVTFTDGIYIESPNNVKAALELEDVRSIEPENYKSGFLDLIKVLPNASQGRHSLANQWGADVLSRIVLGKPLTEADKARSTLYFKYASVLPLNESEIKTLIDGRGYVSESKPRIIDASGKSILLIDDEADKGWEKVLTEMLIGWRVFDCFKDTAKNFSDMEQKNEKIWKNLNREEGYYDLIFLDLRMDGINEDTTTSNGIYMSPDKFSGMRILKEIKKINKGAQVIIFTASNKAWNLKALLDAGADGYYIKESPEYGFSLAYSRKNSDAFCKAVENCLNRGYLREIYCKKEQIRSLIKKINDWNSKEKSEVLEGIEVAYDLLARTEKYHSFAYTQLFLAIEKYAKSQIKTEPYKIFLMKNGNRTYKIFDRKDVSIVFTDGNYEFNPGGGYTEITEEKLKDNAMFCVSVILIFKFGRNDSRAFDYDFGDGRPRSIDWDTVRNVRNESTHGKNSTVSREDFNKITDFMLYFFDDTKANWRPESDALK